MKERDTRFAYVLSRIGMRPGELANQTGIDKTLISRWRSGKRRLAPESHNADKIVDCLLAQENAQEIIGRTLVAYGLDDTTGSLRENLIFWLGEVPVPTPLATTVRATRKNQQGKEYNATVHVMLGEEGIRNAILTQADYLASLPGNHNVHVLIDDSRVWASSDPQFLKCLFERLDHAFQRGLTISIAGRDFFTGRGVVEYIGPWLAAHLNGHVQSYYFNGSHLMEEKDDLVYSAAQGAICSRVVQDRMVEDKVCAVIYTDDVHVRQIYNLCRKYMDKARPQYKLGFLSKPGNILRASDNERLLGTSSYLYTRVPSFGTIPQKEVYQFVNIRKRDATERTGQLSALFHTPDEFAPQAMMRHVYCLEDMEDLVQQGRHANAALSAAYDRGVNFSKKLVPLHLARIREWMQSCDNYQVAFLPKRLFDKIPLEFITFESKFTVAFSQDGAQSTCVKDETKTAALYSYAEHLWEGISSTYKDKARSVRFLNKLLRQPE